MVSVPDRWPRIVVALWVVGRLGASWLAAAPVAEAVSPDGNVRAAISLESVDGKSAPHWQVSFQDRPVLVASPLSIELTDGVTLGADCRLVAQSARDVQSRYEQHPGKRRHVAERGREIVVELEEQGPPVRRWQIFLRAYDDGAALRYVFPNQPDWSSLAVAAERTVFRFPPAATGWTLPLDSFTTSHEGRYERRALVDVPRGALLGLPLLVELPGGGWAALTEANRTDYAGLYLAREADEGARLVSRLSPLPGESGLAVRAPLPHRSPWRVVMVASCAHELIDSDLLLHLNEPSAISDVSWICPGKTTFPWWNGYYEPHVDFEVGLNTATMKHYIDFCAEAGIAYHSLDGKGNTAWYGGPIVPYEGADITRAIATLDLPAVLQHAREKGVQLRLWMHWEAAQRHMERAFPLYREWGVEGVMIDFMDRDDQEMVRFQRRLLELAAANRLTVTFHGVAPPTGLERTYPNLLTSEGVLNLEYDKWDERGVAPEHEVTIPFTRMLAGPLDFHQGSLRGVPPEQFRPRNEAPWVIGTPCRTLASYVVWQNHLPMMADYPAAYRGQGLTSALAEAPCTWDDTRALAGEPGRYVAIARRSGDAWWLGAMNDRNPRSLRLPLSFLPPGAYEAVVYRDDAAHPHGFAKERREARSTDALDARLAPAGGFVARLNRLRSKAP